MRARYPDTNPDIVSGYSQVPGSSSNYGHFRQIVGSRRGDGKLKLTHLEIEK
jgi:hypothetical protein